MTDWATLVKNRTPAVSVRNSGHMVKCMETVQNEFPKAQIVMVKPGQWQLQIDGQPMSGMHNSHYACWADAKEAMNEPH